MVSFKSLLVATSAALTAMALPNFANNTLSRRQTVSSGTGNINGYFYSLWTQANTGATMDVGTGSYSLSWQTSSQNVVGGVGWNPGSSSAITYSGTFNCASNQNCYLSVYGWTTSPLIEYYIVESYGSYNPGSAATLLGSVTSDGGTYNIYHTVRTNEPSIIGTATFDQFWSVRTSHRVGGTVTVANHFAAWSSHGLSLGSHNYQILATEGYMSSGSSSISVSHGGSSSPPPNTTNPPSTTTPPPSGGGGAAHWGQCGGIGWTGPTTCQSPYTCQVINSYYSQCL
jgi:endo-1,4-beta-xylanase